MEQSKTELLERAGIDTADALARFMGNEALLERFLKKFLDDPNYGALKAAMAMGDQAGAVTASHTLKGMCGNLSMSRLSALFTSQVALLRQDDMAGAAGLMPEIAQAYEEAAAAIRRCIP